MSEIRHLEGCAVVVDSSKCCLFSAVCHHNIKLLKSDLSAPQRGADNERLCVVLIWWHFRGRGFHNHRHTLMATLQSHPQTEWPWRAPLSDTGCKHLCARLSCDGAQCWFGFAVSQTSRKSREDGINTLRDKELRTVWMHTSRNGVWILMKHEAG